MAIYATTGNQIAALKELYTGEEFMKDLVYANNPLLALIPKDERPQGFAGKYIPVPLVYGTPQGRSATFATAQANQTAPYVVSFFVYRVENYGLATISNELIEATKNDAGAFVDESKLVVDTSIRNFSNDIALDLFGNGSGIRGVIGSGPSTGVITLSDPSTVVNFEVGMSLVSFSISGTTYTQSTSAAVGYVIAVNRTSGLVTVSATQGGAAGTPTNWSTSFPNLAVEGDVSFGAHAVQTSYEKISGLSAWLPSSSPSAAESFWGVDRSADPTRLAGVRYDGSSQTIEEALIDACALSAREGGKPDMCFMSFASYAALEKSLGSKVQYVDVSHEEAGIAFQAIRVHAPYGPISIIPDRSCPAQTAFILQMNTWKLRSLGKVPHILTYGMEGLEALRVGNADALEIRLGSYSNLTCNAPGWNCRVSLSQ